jgi:hypothetical protein
MSKRGVPVNRCAVPGCPVIGHWPEGGRCPRHDPESSRCVTAGRADAVGSGSGERNPRLRGSGLTPTQKILSGVLDFREISAPRRSHFCACGSGQLRTVTNPAARCCDSAAFGRTLAVATRQRETSLKYGRVERACVAGKFPVPRQRGLPGGLVTGLIRSPSPVGPGLHSPGHRLGFTYPFATNRVEQ